MQGKSEINRRPAGDDDLEELIAERTKQLVEEKNKLQVILNHVPSAFVMVDRDLTIRSASAALTDITGRDICELIGQKCYSVICEGAVVRGCAAKSALNSCNMESGIVEFPDRGNGKRYIENVAIPIMQNGRTESVLEILTDVTERKRMQGYLIKAEKLSAVGQISAAIAHQIRNGLTSVKLILQHLGAALPANDSKKKAATVAVDSIKDMEKVVRQLLDFARPSPSSLHPVNVIELMHESVDFCRQQISLRQLTLEEDYANHELIISADKDHLKESIVNLILNAVQASSEGGMLRIAARPTELTEDLCADFVEKMGRICLDRGQDVLQISVSDSGHGISEEDLNHIFDPFFTTKIDGSGLGLFMAQRTVFEHAGVIEVDSKRGQGSTFTIHIPLS
jgi:two-component system sensor histidine kinase HydH